MSANTRLLSLQVHTHGDENSAPAVLSSPTTGLPRGKWAGRVQNGGVRLFSELNNLSTPVAQPGDQIIRILDRQPEESGAVTTGGEVSGRRVNIHSLKAHGPPTLGPSALQLCLLTFPRAPACANTCRYHPTTIYCGAQQIPVPVRRLQTPAHLLEYHWLKYRFAGSWLAACLPACLPACLLVGC